MTKDNLISMQPWFRDELNELIRQGARKLLSQAIEKEVQELLDAHTGRHTPEGRTGVVRNGHQPVRMVQTGIGPAAVKIPKVPAKTGAAVTFRSTLVPPYVLKSRSLEAALPWLYLKGISSVDMNEALQSLLGPEAQGLSATTVSRLKQKWAREHTAWRNTSWSDRKFAIHFEDRFNASLGYVTEGKGGESRLPRLRDGLRCQVSRCGIRADHVKEVIEQAA